MELIIIKLLFNYNIYNKYYKTLDLEFVKYNSKYSERLLKAIELFHEKFPEKGIQSSDELEVFYYSLFPAVSQKEREQLDPIFRRLQSTTVTEEIAEDYFKGQRQRTEAAKLALLAIKVSEGTADFSELAESMSIEESLPPKDFEFVEDNDLDGRPPVGIRWHVDCLNKMMGSLRKGNFGFLFARPESGKTTFLAHFASVAIPQLSDSDGPLLWFNNEQPGIEVLHRCIQSYFGITSTEFYAKKRYFVTRYLEESKGKVKIIDDATISKISVERICSKYKPSIIIFDQIDKIKGFTSDRKDLEYKEIYQWARELSKKYGPVLGVCQAGGTGEGKKWLTMEDVDSSKTSKQGEADWILGIGKSHQEGMENIRHFHLCKNKLLGDEDTDPKMRHGKADVILKADIARYEDIKK